MSDDNKRPLNPRQLAFIDHYFECGFNAAEAVRRAGYSATGANTKGALLLADERIAKIVAARKAEAADEHANLKRALIERWKLVALGDVRTLYHSDGRLKAPHEMTADEAAMLSSLTVAQTELAMGDDGMTPTLVATRKLKFIDALKAGEMIGKHLGMFVERIGDPDGKPLQTATLVVNFVKPQKKE